MQAIMERSIELGNVHIVEGSAPVREGFLKNVDWAEIQKVSESHSR